MTLESQKMIVGDQKPPSIIFQRGRVGEFLFCFGFFVVVSLNSSVLFVWGFLACKLFIHRQYALNQPSIKKQYHTAQWTKFILELYKVCGPFKLVRPVSLCDVNFEKKIRLQYKRNFPSVY